MATTTPDLSLLDNILLMEGEHGTREEGVCLLEAAALVAGEDHSDTPRSVPCDVALLGQRVNDAPVWDTDQQRTDVLLTLIPAMLQAVDSPEAAYARDCLVVSFAAGVLSDRYVRAGWSENAKQLRALPRPYNDDTLQGFLSRVEHTRPPCMRYSQYLFAWIRPAAEGACARTGDAVTYAGYMLDYADPATARVRLHALLRDACAVV